MKKLLFVFGVATISAFAADVTGYVVDNSCAKNKAMWTNSACVEKCAGKGQALVLVTEEGKIYQVTDQAKIKAHGGHKVTVTGKVRR